MFRMFLWIFFVGDNYSIVDMAALGWVKLVAYVLGADALANDYPSLKRWFMAIDARPVAERARNVGSDVSFKTTDDEESQCALFAFPTKLLRTIH